MSHRFQLAWRTICPFPLFSFLSNCCPRTRNAIRDYDLRYAVTAHMWPSFLYPKGRGNPKDPSDGLFKGELLVRVCFSYFNLSWSLYSVYFQAFCCVFTSPASARREIYIEDDPTIELQEAHRKRQRSQRTRCDVADLLKMRSVQPRAIAYIAVLVSSSFAFPFTLLSNSQTSGSLRPV